jgi:hypothetical protein
MGLHGFWLWLLALWAACYPSSGAKESMPLAAGAKSEAGTESNAVIASDFFRR